MAITIIATAGSASANSFITLAAAEAYFLGRPFCEDWAAASEATKNIALVGATRRLEQEKWRGIPTATTQALGWPRAGVSNAGYGEPGEPWYGGPPLLADDAIPTWLQYAACELALVLLANNLLEDTGLELIDTVGVGDLNVTPRKGRAAGRLPEHVARYCRPYLVNSGGKVDLQRS
jgi:hypothetical protein